MERKGSACPRGKVKPRLTSCRLEQLDGIAVRIEQLDLPTSRPDFHLVAESQTVLLELRNDVSQGCYSQNDAIPAARLLACAIGQRARARGSRPAQQQMQRPERHIRKGRQLLMLDLETQLLDVELDRSADVRDLVADAMKFAGLEHEQSPCAKLELRFTHKTLTSAKDPPRSCRRCPLVLVL